MLEMRERYLWAAPDGTGNGGFFADGAALHGSILKEEVAATIKPHLLLVCKSNLERECLFNGLAMNGLKLPIIAHSAISRETSLEGVVVILMHIGSRRLSDPFFSEEIETTIKSWYPIPVVLLAEREDWDQVVRAMEIGARGYIPTSVDTKVCVEAIHLAMAGGMYIPSTMLMKSKGRDYENDALSEIFTAREIEVVQAIRVGKSNKVIAYELSMSEGTVKAHVHNIMKKIGAANRTEVACKLHKKYGSKFDGD